MDRLLHIIKRFIPVKLFNRLSPAYHFLLAWSASIIYRKPSERIMVIGVTGTTGKTTSAYLIAKVLEGCGIKTGYTSTAMFNDGRREWLNDKKMTMPGRFFTQKILARMIKNGCRFAVIETTSEGVKQYRHRFINYDALIFTGLYPEHLEAHGGFENYKKAKGRLFAHLKKCRTKYIDDNRVVKKTESSIKKLDYKRVKKIIIANLDDPEAKYFLNFWAEEKYAYSKEAAAHEKNLKIIQYKEVEPGPTGTGFKINNTNFNLQLLGSFSATNAMNAVCLGIALSLDLKKIKESLEKITGVPGRLEKIDKGQNFIVVVDYAFEPNAVEKLYDTLNLISHNQKIHVLGATGGGRDVSRRPILGKIAGAKADIVIITNEDPYDDDPQIIVDQVALGAEKSGKIINENLYKIMDRRQAINKALSLAKKRDIVLITGKGSEQAICLAKGEKLPWDDRVVVKEELQKMVVDK